MDARNLVSLYTDTISARPEVILDIGCHDLRDSLILSESFPLAKIHSFEANPSLYNTCLVNNRYPSSISVHNKAVSNVDETINFYLTPGNIGASSMLKPIDWVPWTSNNQIVEIQIEAVRLDTWLQQNNIPQVDLMWMDVQGAELMCLEGLGMYLSDVKMIQTEVGVEAYYQGHTLYPAIHQYLETNGFKQIFRKNDWSHEDNVVYVNTRFI